MLKNAGCYWSTATGSAAADLIPGVKSVEIPLSKAELANSIMGDTAETFFPGIISAPISVVCRQEFLSTGAALGGPASIDYEAWTRWNSEVKFKLKVRAVAAAVSSTNPSYTFSRVGLFSHTPISGSHGQLLENRLEFRVLSGCTVSRSTST